MGQSEKEKMLAGDMYKADDHQLIRERDNARRLTRLFNKTREDETDTRAKILRELFGTIEENVFIEPTFRCDYGYNIHVGENFYANFDCVFLDVNEIRIGKNVMLAPRVQLLTAYHPVDTKARIDGWEMGAPITIGDNVWLGAGVIVNPGIKIGSGAVIGSGSVVTKDVPANVVAAGNPCRVIRELNEREKTDV